MMIKILTSLAVVVLASCVAPIEEWSPPQYDAYRARNSGRATEYPLIPRDDGVVEPPGPGSITEGSASHDVETKSSGRMHILELYQNGIDERNALQVEVAGLKSLLERAEKEIARLSEDLAESEARGSALREESARLVSEAAELTSRLVTAQIRRLEAEKLLLESKLEWHRSGSTGAETAGTALEESRAPSATAAKGTP